MEGALSLDFERIEVRWWDKKENKKKKKKKKEKIDKNKIKFKNRIKSVQIKYLKWSKQIISYKKIKITQFIFLRYENYI